MECHVDGSSLHDRERIVTTVTDQLPPLAEAVRAAALTGSAGSDRHAELAARVPALHAIEVGGDVDSTTAASLAGRDRLRVVAWNMERCKFVKPSADLVGALGADVVLATEMDLGMARAGNRHTTRDMAEQLGAAYIYGVEFAELGLGDVRETVWHAGETNSHGYHGNGIIARGRLTDPHLVRLDDGGVWFGGIGKPDQRRLGHRQAMAARLEGWAVPVWLVSVHLESRGDAGLRDAQIARLLDALDGIVGDNPVILGGDLNTGALPAGSAADVATIADQIGLVEPLFARMAAAGYVWTEANTWEPTLRTRPDGTPPPPFTRIDWLFCRGLVATNAATVPAVDRHGSAISDHEAVVADFLLPG